MPQDDIEWRLRLIESKLDGITAVVCAMSIIGLTTLLYSFLSERWSWGWVAAFTAAWIAADCIVFWALYRGYRQGQSAERK
jgi:hypothetical protein